MIYCCQCNVRESVHGNYCRECLDAETKDLSNEELQAMETIYNALGHKLTREQAEAKFAEARARLEREQRRNES
jgi:hypothetical protein